MNKTIDKIENIDRPFKGKDDLPILDSIVASEVERFKNDGYKSENIKVNKQVLPGRYLATITLYKEGDDT